MEVSCENRMNNMDFNMNFDVNNMNMQHSNELLLEIMKYQLVTHDSALYLDTHPNDPIALIRHHEYSTRLRQLKDEFAIKYGPLDLYTPDISGTWRYIESPWPWE
ncbi:MAG TPA: spore coat protein CotJB [Clostridiales bacterium]|nr:spore coat protein CotJB [Clostridiales bacterium]